MPKFDIDAVLRPPEPENRWVQVGGDFGDPWEYGGYWHNAALGQVLVLTGLEGEGVREREAWHFDVPEHVRAQLRLNYPENFENDPYDRAYEQALDDWQSAQAEAHNQAIALPVHRFGAEERLAGDNDGWPTAGDINSICRSLGISAEEWAEMPPYAQWISVGEHYGWHELDCYPEPFTKQALKQFLGDAGRRL